MDAESYDQWYESPRGRWIGSLEAALIRRALRPGAGESLLDVGCGTGFFTRAVGSAIDGPVTGVDINEDWLAYARRRDTTDAIYEVADARALPYQTASFDLVVSIASLGFIDDERAALQEMLRVTRRRLVLGLLNRRSLLWLQKGRNGGSGGYRGAHWHTPGEALGLFDGQPVQSLALWTAVHLPSGGFVARAVEPLWPQWLHTGAFIVAAADRRP